MRRRKPLGKALTSEQLIQALEADGGLNDNQAAEAWWEKRAPTYARRWLLAKGK